MFDLKEFNLRYLEIVETMMRRALVGSFVVYILLCEFLAISKCEIIKHKIETVSLFTKPPRLFSFSINT